MIPVTTSAPCLVCGASHTACGPVADVRPVDIPRTEVKTLTEVRLYEVTVHGYKTRMRLNEADAKEWGGVPVEEPADEPTEESADGTGTGEVSGSPQRRARKSVPNRSRTAADDK